MRKRLELLTTMLLCSVAMWAQEFSVDGIKYIVTSTTDLTVEVTKGGDYNGDIVIPEEVEYEGNEYSVTSIGNLAFWICRGLTSITIPNSVTSIDDNAFSGCRGLTSIIVDSGNTVYDSRENCNAIIETSSNTLHTGCKNTVIPNSVTSIGDRAFEECSGLTSISIPNSVTSIGLRAFSDCSGLTSITIPNSVMSIENEAFSGCSGLTSIVVESGNMVYDSRENCNAIIETSSNTLLSGCKNTVIPNSVTSIGVCAFDGCSGLTSITIPNSVTSIGSRTFYGCSGLTSISIPNSVTSIGGSAFAYCSGLTSIDIPISVTSIGDFAFAYCSGLTSISIPNSVTRIGWSAFSYCSSLTSITIPSSVTSIGNNYAFGGCSSLTSIVVESGNSVYDSRENCNAIIETSSNTLLSGCKNTIIPNSVRSIGFGAFAGCSGLTSITIPNSVTSIGRLAFDGCSGLTSVTIGNSVTNIGNQAFNGCSSLTTINIPYSVTSIGWNAFSGCSSLTSITIPNSVTSIGANAFSGCSGLTVVVVEWDTPVTINLGVFNQSNYNNATLYVPKGSKDAYLAASIWQDFKEIVEISKGDLNGDDEYNISDIIQIVDMMTGNSGDDYLATYLADVNGDGEVDIADIIAIIHLMIEQTNSNAPELAMAPMEEALDTSDHIAASISGNELSVDLENTNQYAGFQMLVTVPNGLQLTDATLDAARTDEHSVLLRQVAEGQYLILGYSLSNSVLKGNTGKLLTLTMEGNQNGDINISNVLFATADAEKYHLNGISIDVSATGIEGINGSLSSEDVIYDLNGRRLTEVPKNGPYIKNGKKYIQK